MTASKIIPVLLCGGSGTRLWPLSRKSYPKQFAPILGEESLFQASARRFAGDAFAAPWIVTGEDFRFIVREQLAAVEMAEAGLMIEPEGRNTGPAALAAAFVLAKQDPETLMLLAPSDHAIADPEAFCAAVMQGAGPAAQGRIVTFGIQPVRPETGYGWLECGAVDTGDGAVDLVRFVEKPDPVRAAEMLEGGRHLWNAGIFLATAGTMIAAFRKHAPDMARSVEAAVTGATTDLGFLRLDPAAWKETDNVSIDYAVMENADNLSVVRFDGAWSDLGSWEAVWQESPRDADGNAVWGNATLVECEGSLLRSEYADIEIVGIGLKNVVAVAMRDAVMVADLSSSQNVRRAVEMLKQKGATQAVQLPIDHRPWGWFETLVLSDRFQVKRIHVHPGAALSLQSHHHRAEHWIVVAGTARVTVDEDARLLTENQSVYIPLGAVHRMENPGKVPMVLIEVQTGTYLGEDDIVRYEDVYARGPGARG